MNIGDLIQAAIVFISSLLGLYGLGFAVGYLGNVAAKSIDLS